MLKTMKKVFCFLLSFALIFTYSVPASAADDTAQDSSSEVRKDGYYFDLLNEDTGKTYEGFVAEEEVAGDEIGAYFEAAAGTYLVTVSHVVDEARSIYTRFDWTTSDVYDTAELTVTYSISGEAAYVYEKVYVVEVDRDVDYEGVDYDVDVQTYMSLYNNGSGRLVGGGLFLTQGVWEFGLMDRDEQGYLDWAGITVKGEDDVKEVILSVDTSRENPYLECADIELPDWLNANTAVKAEFIYSDDEEDNIVAENYMYCTDVVDGVFDRLFSGIEEGTYVVNISAYVVYDYDFDTGEAYMAYMPLDSVLLDLTADEGESGQTASVKLSYNTTTGELNYNVLPDSDKILYLYSYIGDNDVEVDIFDIREWYQYSASDEYYIGYVYTKEDEPQRIEVFTGGELKASADINFDGTLASVIVMYDRETDEVEIYQDVYPADIGANELYKAVIEDENGHELKETYLTWIPTEDNWIFSTVLLGLEPADYYIRLYEYSVYSGGYEQVALYNYELEGDVVLNYCDGQLTQSDANEAYTVYEYENGELVSVSPLTYAGDGVFYHDNYYFESGYDGNWTFELRNADDEIIDTYEDFKFAESGADTRIVTFTFNMANPELLVEEVEAPEWLNKDTLLKLDIMGIDEADGLERVDSEYMLYSVDEGEYKRIIKGLEPGGYIISVSAYTVAYDVETGNTEEDYVIDDMVYYEIFDEDGTISISVTYGENGLNIEELGADKQFYLRDYMNDVLQSEDLITSWLSFSDTNLYGAVYMCYYSYVDERFEVCDSEGNVIDTFVPDFSNVGEEGLLELWVVVDEKTGEAVISAREYPAEITHDTYLKVVVYDENGKEAASDCLKCLGNIEECHRALLKDVEPGEYTVVTYGYSIAEGDYVYISSGIYNLAGDVLVVSDAGGDSLEVLQGGELNKAFYVNIYKNGDNFRSSSWLRYDDKDNSFYHAELFRSGEYTIYVFDCEDDLVAQKTVDFGDGKADSLSDVDVMFDFDTQEITVSENYLPEDININNYVKVIVTQNGSQIVNEYMPVQDDDDYIFSRVINGLSEGKYVVSVLAYSDDYDGYYVEAVKSVDVTEGNALVVTYFDDLTVEQVEASNVTTPDDSTSSDDTQNNGNGTANNTQNSGDNTSNNTQSSGSNTSSGSNQSSKVTAPKTGDSLNVELYILMLMVSGSFAAALCYRRKLNK